MTRPTAPVPPRSPHRSRLAGALLAAGCVLTACGGGADDGDDAAATGGAGNMAITCNTAAYVAGSVEAPSSAQLAAYAGTYNGLEGSYDMSGSFTRSADAQLVLSASGALSYKGSAYAASSLCIDKTAGTYGKLLYIVAGSGHLDISDTTDANLGRAWGVSLADGSTVFTKGLRP